MSPLSATLLFGALTLALYAATVARLRRSHPATDADLGQPRLLHNDFSPANLLLFDSLIKGRFLKSRDSLLVLLASLWYICFAATVGFFVVTLWRG
jgi:hypothetical protein